MECPNQIFYDSSKIATNFYVSSPGLREVQPLRPYVAGNHAQLRSLGFTTGAALPPRLLLQKSL